MSRRLDRLVASALYGETAEHLDHYAALYEAMSMPGTEGLRAAAKHFRDGVPEAQNELRTYFLVDVCEALLRRATCSLSLAEIAQVINLPPSRRRSLSTTLCALRRRGAVRFDRRTRRWSGPEIKKRGGKA